MSLPTDNLTTVDLAQLQTANHWQAQFRLLTQWGMLITHKPEIRVESNRVRGCEVAAWLTYKNNSAAEFTFYFDSDSRIIKGLAALLLAQINGRNKETIQALDLIHLLTRLGITKHLTPSRNNGFHALVMRIQDMIQEL